MDPARTYELLVRLSDLLRAEERRLGQDLGLTSVHLHALGFLGRANRYSDNAASLAEFLGVTKGTASQTVAVLVARGLLRQRRDERDGRRLHLELTGEGRGVVAAAEPPPLLAQALSALDGERTSRGLEAGLEGLLRELQRAGGSRAFGVCHTCRHFRVEGRGYRCALTGESLSKSDRLQICREHEFEGSAS